MRDTFLVIDSLSARVRLLDCGELEACLPIVLAGVPYRLEEHSGRSAFASVIFANGRYRVHAPKLGALTYQKDAINAACDLVSLIARHLASIRPDLLVLHAAAVVVNDALVVFPAGKRGGKSVLTLALAQFGARVFCDDVLPIRLVPGCPIEGVAFGVSPRARLPLPDGSDLSAGGMNKAPTAENKQYRYIAVPQLAKAGERMPIAAFVMLSKSGEEPPSIRLAARGPLLGSLLKQNFGRSGPAETILAGLHMLASSAVSLELLYRDPLQSASLLLEELSTRLRPQPIAFRFDQSMSAARQGAPRPPSISDKLVYHQRDGAVVRELDGVAFASSSDGARIVRLNDTLRQIWHLLAEPSYPSEVIDLMRTAFPEIPADQIETDVETALAELAATGLISSSAVGISTAAL